MAARAFMTLLAALQALSLVSAELTACGDGVRGSMRSADAAVRFRWMVAHT